MLIELDAKYSSIEEINCSSLKYLNVCKCKHIYKVESKTLLSLYASNSSIEEINCLVLEYLSVWDVNTLRV